MEYHISLNCGHRKFSPNQQRSVRCLSGVNLWGQELNTDVKKTIEDHWRNKLFEKAFDENSPRQKFYVCSMFPYPSGKLHMGHVRVYAISDTVARFHRLRGKNVIHPMGWDAFGLPAENAALDSGADPDDWTQKNISSMKEHMEEMNLSFDWNREFATCDSDYYKWTQYFFLKLMENNLVYRKEALVNWDPVDKTVLANEQVDENGISWRSGAKVEKKLLKQWFIRTTWFIKQMYDGLSDPKLRDWKDVLKLQRHWIGECNGTTIDFEVIDENKVLGMEFITLWMREPEHVEKATFVAVRPGSIWSPSDSLLQSYKLKNPFTTDVLPVYATEDVDYAEATDCHLGIPDLSEKDKAFAKSVNLPKSNMSNNVMSEAELLEYREKICAEARRRSIGGYPTSSKFKDWLISRQRYWGTPIPVVYCKNCEGPQPVPESALPVKLPGLKKIQRGLNPLLEATDWLKTTCPSCGGEAERESDTMDTFVDSSWYYLRFLDPDQEDIPFRKEKSDKFMPIDLYIGGKEHATLHLFYSRFFGYFLHAAGLMPEPEPFLRLLTQGMVRGKSFRVKGSDKYVPPSLVETKDGKTVHKETQEPIVVGWEKMSKSKFNGVEPSDMFDEFGVDTTRLIMLADVTPMSSRNWSRDTFAGMINWQNRLWRLVQNFIIVRSKNVEPPENTEEMQKEDDAFFETRNSCIKKVQEHLEQTYYISVAITNMLMLTTKLMKASDTAVLFSLNYERALATQIILLGPVAPHFASELWAGFLKAPNRLNRSHEIQWDKPVLLQRWPKMDENFNLDVRVTLTGKEICVFKVPRSKFNKLTLKTALNLALNNEDVRDKISDLHIVKSFFSLMKDNYANLSLTSAPKEKDRVEEPEKVMENAVE